MKILLILSLALELLAFDSATASKIFDKIFHAIVLKKSISVYTVNETYKEVIVNAPDLFLTNSYKEADIILVDDFSEIPKGTKEKLLFSTSYPVFKKIDNVVGAFYWDRGHIKIEFSKKRLFNHKISLPDSFDKYVKDDL